MQDQVTIYYNADNPESRTLLGYTKALGIPVLAFDIRKRPLTPMQLLYMASRLKMPIAEMVCQNKLSQRFKHPQKLSIEDWALLLQKQPDLLRKPIAVRKGRVAFLHSANEILQL